MLSELMDDKLVVTTKGGRIAIRWMADDIQKLTEKCKKDIKKGKHTPDGDAVNDQEKPAQQPSPMPVSPTASEVIDCINEHLALDPNPNQGQENVQSDDSGLQGQEEVQDEEPPVINESPNEEATDETNQENDRAVTEAEQEDKQNDPVPADSEQVTKATTVPKTPNQEQNNNLNKSPLTLESLESLGAHNTVESTPDC